MAALERVKNLKGEVNTTKVQADYEEWYRQTKERFEAREQRQLAMAFWNRHRVHLWKLAAIYEMSQTGSLTVSGDAFERATQAARSAEETIFALLPSGFNKEGASIERVYEVVKQAGPEGITKSTLTRAFMNVPEYIRESRIKTLIDAERIYKQGRKTAGRPAEVFIADVFLHPAAPLPPMERTAWQ